MSSLAAPPSRTIHLVEYKREKARLKKPLLGAVALMIVIVLLGFLSKHDNILDLLKSSQTEAMSPPARESMVEMELVLVPPPPPVDNPDFVKPVEVIKQETPTPPKPVIKPVEQSPATTTNNVFAASSFKAGDPNLPKPPYPIQAKLRRQQGTVLLSVTMSSGHVTSVTIAQSSGFGILDSTSRQWASERWTFPDKYSGTFKIPVDFQLISQ